jgi:hypothetical protein
LKDREGEEEDNINIDVREVHSVEAKWIELAQNYVQWWA